MEIILHNIIAFIVILSVIVFIHEFGHYLVARFCGVKIEQFSIGFGKELFGFNNRHGTRWKFCLLPFGGYVKMFGDRNPASVADHEQIRNFSESEKKQSFYFQNVYKRIAIVAAGPLANFLLTIVIFTIIFHIQGINVIPPVVGKISKGSAAEAAGIMAGDRITAINSKTITDFEQIKKIVTDNKSASLHIDIIRNEKIIELTATPHISSTQDAFGNQINMPLLGIAPNTVSSKKLNLRQSFHYAITETYQDTIAIIKAIGELITGQRSIKELSGPVRIAEYSGQSVNMGIIMVLWFMAMISLNLGVLNLLPLPVLDGGHLFYYLIEIILGKALPEKVQMAGFQIGLALLTCLMIFTTYNDISHLIH